MFRQQNCTIFFSFYFVNPLTGKFLNFLGTFLDADDQKAFLSGPVWKSLLKCLLLYNTGGSSFLWRLQFEPLLFR